MDYLLEFKKIQISIFNIFEWNKPCVFIHIHIIVSYFLFMIRLDRTGLSWELNVSVSPALKLRLDLNIFSGIIIITHIWTVGEQSVIVCSMTVFLVWTKKDRGHIKMACYTNKNINMNPYNLLKAYNSEACMYIRNEVSPKINDPASLVYAVVADKKSFKRKFTTKRTYCLRIENLRQKQ